MISCINQLSIFDANETDLTMGKTLPSISKIYFYVDNNCNDTIGDKPQEYHTVSTDSDPLPLPKWQFGSAPVPENCKLLFPLEKDAEYATTYEKRKKLFGSKAKRESLTISRDKIYCLDFYDAYFDLTNFSLKVPGFGINSFKYWDGSQPLRYVCRSRDGSKVFFVVQMVYQPLI